MSIKYSAKDIATGFEAALKRAESGPTLEWDLEGLRVVVFSDLHRGRKDGADDFLRCKPTYHRALGYYLEQEYTLVVLGDSEEMWECRRPKAVLRSYPDSFDLEGEFHSKGRFFKVYGNHDDYWDKPSVVEKLLYDWFPGLQIPESLMVSLRSDSKELGRLFLVHGHQGTTFSDRHRKWGRLVVRYLVAPAQRLAKIRATTAARDHKLRKKHEIAMYKWVAGKDGLVLITGHTHHPVFESRPHTAVLDHEFRKLEDKYEHLPAEALNRDEVRESLAKARAELEWYRAKEDGYTFDLGSQQRPCFFNTGCCSFASGDITGLEIEDGEIRLVKWSTDHADPDKRFLKDARADLKQVMKECCPV